jgi:uncharacterized protein (DUF433 family)
MNEYIKVSEVSGVPRLAGHRLTVHFIVYLIYREGMTPEEVAAQYSLTLGQVYAALAFYHDNKVFIDELLAGEDRSLDAVENLNVPHEDELWQVMTVQEIARVFQVDESTVREAVTREWVYGRKAGGTWIISRRDAEQRWGDRNTA